MKLGLYSISYAGMWYDGPALSIKEVAERAKRFGLAGIELGCRAPHAVPYLLGERERKEIVDQLGEMGIELSALAANNDFSCPVIEHRDANVQMVVEMIRLCRDLGAPVLRIFTAWEGTTRRGGVGSYDEARWAYHNAFPGVTTAERWQYCLDAFRTVARFAEEADVTLALQNHPPVVRNHQDVLAMIAEVNSPHFKMSFDISGERAWQDTDWILAAARRIGDNWVHSHLSGAFERGEDGMIRQVPMGRAAGPDDNIWNTEAWVRAMCEVGYAGYVNYEACTPIYTSAGRYVGIEAVDEAVALARDYLTQLIDKYSEGGG